MTHLCIAVKARYHHSHPLTEQAHLAPLVSLRKLPVAYQWLCCRQFPSMPFEKFFRLVVRDEGEVEKPRRRPWVCPVILNFPVRLRLEHWNLDILHYGHQVPEGHQATLR
ncbi:hypothetical protein LAV84_26880 [Rhizobium sp. VS19-DR104.2]|uniref:hypothetical protein n=1 Tax=unclassified Rhizobium TaxID=2613769 RepID=UPI001ADC2DC0|nr:MULTISPECIES: hypothetical protein [unclassified Rhizobium]MBO9101225.1 hypothetical protein [Rhizobium sp. L58/93]MBO9170878.1 hypothetical protein [Rhizobium sp. L245/93]MBO9186791.1 hypothetical protein [Rhizobium sp. E27B/91]MBZ5763138.1 hypothetical protein [Rhizobium sp. VS19-DR96]MBZ5769054.1 hypothetical protein [Rhizobium sp. VS19-DR129.2]